MNRKWLFILLTLVGSTLGGMIAYDATGLFFRIFEKKAASMPSSPYPHSIIARGFIEPSSVTMHIGTPIAGVVEEVYVKTGDFVKAGDPLFKIDTRELMAQLRHAEASYKKEVAILTRLEKEPRSELLPPLEAEVKRAKMRLSDEAIQYGLFQHVSDKRAISFSEYTQRKYTAAVARYDLERAKAELALVQAGAWEEDIHVAAASAEEAKAAISLIETNLERAVIRAPVDGQVLKVDVNKGDFADGGYEDNFNSDPFLTFGVVSPLHLRVEVDQEHAWQIFPGARATAYVKGNSKLEIPLEFIRIEPCIISKPLMEEEGLSKVDNRVLEVIYRLDKKDLPIYIGQLVDVYVEARAL